MNDQILRLARLGVWALALDNWNQSVAAIFMTASAAWMAIALRRFE